MDINTCFETTNYYHSIAYYSHLVPVFIVFVLSIFVLIKTKFSLLSRIFAIFALTFCLWLIGDVITWTSNSYDLISAVWSSLDLFNILFYLFGAYFFSVLVNGLDISIKQKIFFLLLSLPAWWITYNNLSISEMYQPVCEALNNDLYMKYKLLLEIGVIVYIIFLTIYGSIVKARERWSQLLVVAIGFILFFSAFGGTEYIAGTTGIYEMNLYSLFVLPVFLFLIVYASTNLQIFNLKLIGTQLLSYTLIILVGSQFFFLQNTSDRALTGITFLLSLGFGILLIRNARRELEQREKIEKLARQLENLVHFISHEVKGALGKAHNTFNEILEGDYGSAPEPMRELVSVANSDTEKSISMVINILRSSDLKKGKIVPKMEIFDVREALLESIDIDKHDAELKHLTLDVDIDSSADFKTLGDKELISKHVIKNLIDNAIAYTLQGGIKIRLTKNSSTKKILFSIKDSGVGITPEDMKNLFTEGGRGQNSTKINVHSTGYGLFFAKQITEAHQGKIWVESEGEGKGSTFFVELNGAE